MTYDRAAIMKAAWVIVRGADVARFGLRTILRNALRFAWTQAKRAAAEARRRAEAARPCTEADRIRDAILALECKDRLSLSDLRELDRLRTDLGAAIDREAFTPSTLAA